MKKNLFLVFICITTLAYTQQDKNITQVNKTTTFWKNVRFGGGLGLNFGNNFTTISVTPTAVYDFNNKFSLGGSLGYTYSKNNDFKSNVYTASILTIVTPIDPIELSTEFEQLFVNSNFSNNYNYSSLYLGIAYKTQNVSVGGRYDVLYDDDKSIYSSPFTPFVRVFF